MNRFVAFFVALATVLVAGACSGSSNPAAPSSASSATLSSPQEFSLRQISDTFSPGAWQGYGIRNNAVGGGILRVQAEFTPTGEALDLAIMEEKPGGNCDRVIPPYPGRDTPTCLVIKVASDPMANPKTLDIAVDNLDTIQWVSFRPKATALAVTGSIKFIGVLK